MPCPLKKVIINEEMDAVTVAVRFAQRGIETYPFQPDIQLNRPENKNAIFSGQLKAAEFEIVAITLEGFQRHSCSPP